ncbi:hypothetical protein TRSC58_01331 [Trypanosoma rangeli SC58]|uniref:FYVE, RhoGEF and PH domain-containing protein 2 n=1 Tax=Trypanosoma rangeli SC58 TaxID=429131 RepID=A0A061J672_TRYRA|nr:hypothetical protein TRSC58_01331 [Trypanosoma rangeli SC58]
MNFDLDELFDTRPRQQQQQHGGPTYVPPPPPSDPPPPPVWMQQDPFGMNATAAQQQQQQPPPPPPPPPPPLPPPPMQPFEVATYAPATAVPYQTHYLPSHAPQSYGENGYKLPSSSLPSGGLSAALPAQTAYYAEPTSTPVHHGPSYQASLGVPDAPSIPQTVRSSAVPSVPPPSQSEPAVMTPIAVKESSVLAQEEEDRKQLEKIIQLRKELEKERERERKKQEELETWGCSSCTYRNALDVNRCEMCDSNRPGYLPPPNVAPPSTAHSDARSSFPSSSKTTGVQSGVAGPTAWVCGICLAPNEAHHFRCKVCGSYQKNGTPITGVDAKATGTTPGVYMPPSAWLCGICGKKNAANAARCVGCSSYQSNGTPLMDPGLTPQTVTETASTTWKCSVCTLENPVSSVVCDACQSGQRPRHLAPPRTNDRTKNKSGAESRDANVARTWPCPTCTYQNAIVREKCDMCTTERPSQYKPPPPPNTKEAEDSDDDIQWQDDEAAKECNRCHLPFNLTRRRHHCRACGFVFCGVCSSYQRALKRNGSLERVCVSCYEAQKRE